MKIWKIPVSWSVCSVIDIEADTLAEAIEIAKDEAGIIPLPDESSYVDGSWELSMDEQEEIRVLYNQNQTDDVPSGNFSEV